MEDNKRQEISRWHKFNKSFLRGALLLIDSFVLCVLYLQEKLPKGKCFSGLMEKENFYSNKFNRVALDEINEVSGMLLIAVLLFLILSCIDSDFIKSKTLKLYNFSLFLHSIVLGGYVAYSMYVMKYVAYVYIFYSLVAVICLITFCINLFYYNVHRDILKREKRPVLTWLEILLSAILVLGWSVYCIGDVPKELESQKKELYREYMLHYIFDKDEFYFDDFNDGNDNLRYTLVQYVNYFGESKETYTVEELKASVEALSEAFANSSQEAGLWYEYYQFVEDYKEIFDKYDFTAYNYWVRDYSDYESNSMCYASCVDAILREDGNSLEKADASELEVACRKAYEFLSNAQVKTIEEVTFEIKQPKAGELMDFTAAYNSEEYVASFTSWLHGSTYYYEEDGKCFEDGRTYEANVIIHANIGYKFSDDVKINIEGIEYNRYDVNFSHSNNILYISIFENVN